MPVIRGRAPGWEVTPEQRREVADRLVKELSGQSAPDGPVIFEIPFERHTRIDVLVIWDAWKPFRSIDRTDMIHDAYRSIGSGSQIAQALGLTYQEAVDQQVLPFAVIPMVRSGDVDEADLKKAMLAAGGFARSDGKVDLRFPTKALAEEAHKRLTDALPKGYWSITQSIVDPE